MEEMGRALEENEQVSNQIASLVQYISASARQQATTSQSISRNMQVLREISSQTAESTTATSVNWLPWLLCTVSAKAGSQGGRRSTRTRWTLPFSRGKTISTPPCFPGRTRPMSPLNRPTS